MLIIGVTFIDQLKPYLLQPGRVRDEFARANLQAQVAWTGWEKLPGVILLLGVLVFVLRASQSIRRALVALFLASLLAINLTIVLITPKVEPYSQGAAVEFYKIPDRVLEHIGFNSRADAYSNATDDDA